ncbi:cell division protein FtsZ, partial [bacterium]|nr:cell division protein FtsZ [bacterium]
MVLEFDEGQQSTAVIKVIGLGGGGCNAVDSMMRNGLQFVEFVVANTDKQALAKSLTPFRIQLGEEITQGLGTGAKPEIGELAAQEAKDEIRESLRGADMIFIAAGLGGGTGTGAAPVVADIAKELGALTVAIVTKPFRFEGRERMKIAESGASRLKSKVDALMVIPNDHLLQVAGEKTPMIEAFEIANRVLLQAVSSITDLINVPGLINVDFADIRTIIGNTGGAVMGIGIGKGD